MSDDKEQKPEQVEKSVHERDVEMFRLWYSGMSTTDIAKQYGVSQQLVSQISLRDKWKGTVAKIKQKAFLRTLDELKDTAVQLKELIDTDIKAMVADVKAKDRYLTKDERAHLRAVFDRYLKEIRLEDGKPTEVIGGSVEQVIRLRLPPGRPPERAFIIPPPAATKIILDTEEDKSVPEEQLIDKVDSE